MGEIRSVVSELRADPVAGFDRLAADIATNLLSLPPERVDERIEDALGEVCRFLDVDFATVLQWKDPEKSSLIHTHEWGSSENSPRFAGTSLAGAHPWLDGRLAEATPLLISQLDDFPPEALAERATSAHMGIRSVAWVPFRTPRGLEGHVAVNTIGRERAWSEIEVDQLRLIGQIFANALERRRADLRLREAYEELESLKQRLEKENVSLRASVGKAFDPSQLVGRSDALRWVERQVDQVAPTDSTVLMLGETGTGKSLVARAIHARSKRRDGPFISVNCAALPESLLESELFGHEKGAFTSAVTQAIGRFEAAEGGTIFLDEIGELPMHLQVKLHRVVQDREFERIGSAQTRTADVRIVAATNRDLEEMIGRGAFRSDLYYRLSVFPIHMPPLRARHGDIPLLVWYFIAEIRGRLGKSFDQISERDMYALESYAWPGNVRELENVVERAMILSSEPRLEVDGLLPSQRVRGAGDSHAYEAAASSLEQVERAHIVRILEECGWRIRGEGGAAERLGLKRTTLQSRMKKLGITRPQT